MFRFLPEPASEIAPKIDWLNNLITDLSVFFTVVIVGAMIFFAIRYRQRGDSHHETPQIRGSHFLEFVWTVVPTIVCIILAYHGIVYYREMREIPKDALTINVVGKKWQWDFQYENGKKIEGKRPEFVVPVDKDIKLVLTSRDVLHSFFIPSMRVKRDAVPGQYHYLMFKPVKTGTYPVFCTEYCGTEHSDMMASLRVVSAAEYDRWVNDRSAELAMAKMGPTEKGKALYTQKGCNACHSLNGTTLVGPSFLNIWGRDAVLADGSQIKADENYIRESVLNPAAKLVKGYGPVMPSFAGQLSDDDIEGLIAFLKTVDGSQPAEAAPAVQPSQESAEEWAKLTPVQRGEKWYREKAQPACSSCHSIDGTKVIGPTFKGLYGKSGKLADGSAYSADDGYIKNAILNPMAQIVEGYPGSMPPIYQTQLKDEDVKDIIEWLKTLK